MHTVYRNKYGTFRTKDLEVCHKYPCCLLDTILKSRCRAGRVCSHTRITNKLNTIYIFNIKKQTYI